MADRARFTWSASYDSAPIPCPPQHQRLPLSLVLLAFIGRKAAAISLYVPAKLWSLSTSKKLRARSWWQSKFGVSVRSSTRLTGFSSSPPFACGDGWMELIHALNRALIGHAKQTTFQARMRRRFDIYA
jgi:hypothetical protein